MNKRPNILMLVTDDQRFDTIAALGNPHIITTNMDRLVERGMSFTHAYIPGGTVGAVCMPSRAMLHTGRNLFGLQECGANVPKEHMLLGQTLRQAGYLCYGTGKWHNGPAAFSRAFETGDDIFFSGMWDHWNVPLNRYDPTGEYDTEVNFISDFRHGKQTEKIRCDHFYPGVHSSTIIADSSVRFLEQAPKDRPFFLYAAFLAPHDPRSMPERFRRMYEQREIPLPVNFLPEHPFEFGAHDLRDERLAPYPRTEADTREQTADYYAMITHLDYEVGRILDALEQRGDRENTLIILISDNGLCMGSHGLFGKQNLYEESVRVPMVLQGPGITAGTCDSFVYLFDLYPTIGSFLGLPIPASVQGKSFASLFQDPRQPHRESLYFAYRNSIRAMCDGRYKMICYNTPESHTQLFDLENDPWEMNDLSGTGNSARICEHLRGMAEQYREMWNEESCLEAKGFWQGK